MFATKLDGLSVPTENRYLVFGAKGEYFGLHLIQGKPNFDALVQVARPIDPNNGPCTTRLCDGPRRRAVPDSQLPLELAANGFEIPKVKDLLGGTGGIFTDIQRVIYVE